MAKKRPASNECPGIVCNALKPHYRWFDIVFEGRFRGMFGLKDNGVKNTFFPGLKLLFPHKEDKPYRLRRTSEGQWEGRNNKGAWLKLGSTADCVALNSMLEEMWQRSIIEAVMTE